MPSSQEGTAGCTYLKNSSKVQGPEMAQQKIVLADLAEDLGSVTSTQMLGNNQFQGHPLSGLHVHGAQTKDPYTFKINSSKHKVQSKEEAIYY